jgi:hypothetical protein
MKTGNEDFGFLREAALRLFLKRFKNADRTKLSEQDKLDAVYLLGRVGLLDEVWEVIKTIKGIREKTKAVEWALRACDLYQNNGKQSHKDFLSVALNSKHWPIARFLARRYNNYKSHLRVYYHTRDQRDFDQALKTINGYDQKPVVDLVNLALSTKTAEDKKSVLAYIDRAIKAPNNTRERAWLWLDRYRLTQEPVDIAKAKKEAHQITDKWNYQEIWRTIAKVSLNEETQKIIARLDLASDREEKQNQKDLHYLINKGTSLRDYTLLDEALTRLHGEDDWHELVCLVASIDSMEDS